MWLLDRYLNAVYPATPITVVNAGISGHKATDMQARFERDVLAAKPQLVTISVGVNDVWHSFRDFKARRDYPDGSLPNGVPLPLYVEKLEAMIVAAKAAGIRVVLLTPTPIHEDPASPENARLASYVKAMTALGATHKCTVVDLNAAMTRAIAAHQREAGPRVNVRHHRRRAPQRRRQSAGGVDHPARARRAGCGAGRRATLDRPARPLRDHA